MEIVLYIIVAIAFCGVGIFVATTKMRKTLLKKSEDIVKKAESEGEIIKKRKNATG